ncbi:hypothetical protein V6N13_133329 [Hibiscus sabdariffa]|uniref:Uncharacterized protein n=1 Tax=Hibiscus sabdariffa TaxID=183260 RepID=A0ABR2CKC7_9ROSI
MCPGSDIESRGKDLNGEHQHQHQLLRNYNEETIDEDKSVHAFLRKIDVSQLLRRLPLNETREPLNQASPPLFLFSSFTYNAFVI